MNNRMRFCFTMLMLLATVFSGCSSSSNNTPAPAPKARVTTGVITGFGSVIVNGIEFTKRADIPETQAATFKFDDTQHGQTDLRIGMIVTVRGTADTATNKGEFEAIEFSPELRGPASTVVVSGTTGTLSVMGHDVVTSATTSFEGVADVAALQSKITATHHPEIEISGRMDNAGVFHATRIAVKADDFSHGGRAEIHGVIASSPTPSAGGFMIGTTTVVMTGSTILSNLTAAGLAAGAVVEVKGALDVNTNTLTATRIEGSHHGVGEGVEVEDDISIQGIASGAISGGAFSMMGPNGPVLVKVDGATVYAGGASSIVAANALIEVEGTLQADGSVLALEIKSENEIETESHDMGGSGEAETETDGHDFSHT